MATGLVVMTPTSVNVSGGTASIRPDGGVDFSAATSLSLNGVFTSAYDDYMVVVRSVLGANNALRYRLRVAGADATGSNYVRQYIFADSTSVIAARSTLTFFEAIIGNPPLPTCETQYLYGPALAQPTALRQVTVDPRSSAAIVDTANTHSLSIAYDGWTIFPSSGNMTGMITVYGYTQ